MKRILRLTALMLLLVFVAFLVPTIWFKPWSIDHFYSRVFISFALRHPMLLSQLRLLEPMGLDFHADDLDDMSIEFAREEMARTREMLETLRRYNRSSYDANGRLSYDVLEFFLEDSVRGEPFLLHDYPVNQLDGYQSMLPQFMVNYHLVEDLGDARNYLERLEKFGLFFDQLIEGLEVRQERGIVPPRFVIEKVLDEIRPFVAVPATEHLLYEDLRDKLAKVEDLDMADREALLERAALTIENAVFPAYRRLMASLEDQLAVATDESGVWKLPDGEAFYAHQLRSYTTTDLSAEDIHRLGLSEVTRLASEMRAILEGQGIEAGNLGAAIHTLLEDPRFIYADNASGREQILQGYRDIITEFEADLGQYFDPLPKAPVEVQAVPEFMQATAPMAYYEPPTFDGSKAGVFFANLRNVQEHAKFGMRTLAYHEAIPGHHLQLAIAQELEGVPFFRRVLPFTAYAEGWALYAEQLADEVGFQEDSFDRLGYLQAQMFRAVRLVVDTGIHRKRWTREQAIQYMTAHTGMADSEVVAEIERYIVDPGQACAYKVGQLKILELRQRAIDALGDRFDLRDFHRVVLGGGSVPLTLLEQVVDQWIAAQVET